MARHTETDCCRKRGRRGYLFIIGDEMAYPRVKPAEVRQVIGDELGQALPVAGLVAEVTARWDTYYVLPAGASYVGDAQVLGFWRDLLGQNVIELGGRQLGAPLNPAPTMASAPSTDSPVTRRPSWRRARPTLARAATASASPKAAWAAAQPGPSEITQARPEVAPPK